MGTIANQAAVAMNLMCILLVFDYESKRPSPRIRFVCFVYFTRAERLSPRIRCVFYVFNREPSGYRHGVYFGFVGIHCEVRGYRHEREILHVVVRRSGSPFAETGQRNGRSQIEKVLMEELSLSRLPQFSFDLTVREGFCRHSKDSSGS